MLNHESGACLVSVRPLFLIALLSTPFVGVHAQMLEEIIVTAQKREQSLQDVSIAVTAWTGETIRASEPDWRPLRRYGARADQRRGARQPPGPLG